jgi:hypothetical protein
MTIVPKWLSKTVDKHDWHLFEGRTQKSKIEKIPKN